MKLCLHFPYTLQAETIFELLLHIVTLLFIKGRLRTLAKADRAHFAFERDLAARTVFGFMLAHDR